MPLLRPWTGLAALGLVIPATYALAEPAAAQVRIHDIQAAAHVSPLAGDDVADVGGVVTAVRNNGFWMQDPAPDQDPATSEGIFVFTRARPEAKVGDAAVVGGAVTEFRPGGEPSNLTTTEITATDVQVTSAGNPLPAATVIGVGGRIPPTRVIDDDATGDAERSGVFQPRHDGLDFYESLEAMRVRVDDAVAVSPRNRFGEIAVLADDGARSSVRTARGGIVLREHDANPERVILDDVLAGTPQVDVADRFASPVVGVLDYSFGNVKLQITQTPGVSRGDLPREVARPAGPDDLSVATFNVENLDAGDPQQKFDALAAEIVDRLRSPDILAVQEVQDDTGPRNDGVVTDDQTFARLAEAIRGAGGPAYAARSIDPVDGQDGGEPGGNIRVGFLFREDGALAFVDRPGGDATTPTNAVRDDQGRARLTLSPGRIDPGNPAFDDSRKPLAGEFTWRGRRIFVIANHWNSKGGDDPLFGRFQPPRAATETQRRAQAEVVAGFVEDILSIEPGARVVVAGDLNDFEFSAAVRRLTEAGLTDLPSTVPPRERYTYVFDGNSQVLDHILLSPALARGPYSYDIVHTNAEYAQRPSDHDPQLVRLR